MALRRRARIDPRRGDRPHRGVTSALALTVPSRLETETPGIPTGYLRASSDAIEYDPESREVGYDGAVILSGQLLSLAIG